MGCCNSSKGSAANVEEPVALSAKTVAAPGSCDSDILTRHFLGDYRRGLDLQHSGKEYLLTDSSVGDQVYLHKKSGIRTWSRAFDFSSGNASADDLQVVYHYVVEDDFHSLVSQFKSNMLSVLEDRQALFGRGIYCSTFEPDAFGSQEAASCHVRAYCLDDYETNDFCIPIIAHRKDCFDLRRRQLPEMVHGCGKTVHGNDLPEGIDVWVVRIPSAGESGELDVLKTVARNGENRLRLEVMDRLARFDEEHPFVKQSKTRLVACLKAQGKTAEAERVAAGRAVDVSHPPKDTRENTNIAKPAKPDRAVVAKAPAPTQACPPRTDKADSGAKGKGTVSAKEPTRTVDNTVSPPLQESSLKPISEAELAARFDLQNGASQSLRDASAKDGAFCITSDVGMTLDDLKSESTSDDIQGQTEIESRGGDIGELDRQMQWGVVNRRGAD